MTDIRGDIEDLVDNAMDDGLTFTEVETAIHAALDDIAEEVVMEDWEAA